MPMPPPPGPAPGGPQPDEARPGGPQPGWGPPAGPPPGSPPQPHGKPPGTGKNPAFVVIVAVAAVILVVGGAILLTGDDDDGDASTQGTVSPPPSGGLPDPDELEVEVPEQSGEPGESDAPDQSGQSGDATAFCTEGLEIGERYGFPRPEDFVNSSAADVVVSEDDAAAYLADLRSLAPPSEIAADYQVNVDAIEWGFEETGTRDPQPPGSFEAYERLNEYVRANCRSLADQD